MGEAWELGDGSPDKVNASDECLDRHAGNDIRLLDGEGNLTHHTFEALSHGAAQFAHLLENHGVERGDRVAVMVNPSYEFLVAFFGTMKRGAVRVPYR